MSTVGVTTMPPVTSSDTASSEFKPPPDWIAVIVLVGSMLVIAVMIVVVRFFIIRNPGAVLSTRDPESVFVRRTADDPETQAQAISALESLAPSMKYSKLKSSGKLDEIPPDQAGSSVEWSVEDILVAILLRY